MNQEKLRQMVIERARERLAVFRQFIHEELEEAKKPKHNEAKQAYEALQALRNDPAAWMEKQLEFVQEWGIDEFLYQDALAARREASNAA